MADKTITIKLQDNNTWNSEAYLLAQLLKRITWEGVRECAIDKAETEAMIRVIETVRSQLSSQGINPR